MSEAMAGAAHDDAQGVGPNMPQQACMLPLVVPMVTEARNILRGRYADKLEADHRPRCGERGLLASPPSRYPRSSAPIDDEVNKICSCLLIKFLSFTVASRCGEAKSTSRLATRAAQRR